MVDYNSLEKMAEAKKTNVEFNEALTVLKYDSRRKVDELRFLSEIDKYISVDSESIELATNFYESIGVNLSKQLGIDESNVKIYPQGSVSTQTLIRSATGGDFDIDAVCEIGNISPNTPPIQFFESIGDALKKIVGNDSSLIQLEKKKRCWKINPKNSGFYIDLIPGINPQKPSHGYNNDAINIVNTPTKEWQASNPKGFTNWLLQQNIKSSRLIVKTVALHNDYTSESNIGAVPSQEIKHNDYLLLTIRLLKRHRDIMVKNNRIDSECKPISVIICTLLGQTIQAMLENGRTYDSYYSFLEDIVFKLPHMIDKDENGKPLIPNPTAPSENFADRWLLEQDKGKKREENFWKWSRTINEELANVIDSSPENGFNLLKDMFGATTLHFDSQKNMISNIDRGLADHKPLSANNAVPDDGLA